MLLREELSTHKHRLALVLILLTVLCGTFAILHIAHISTSHTAVQQISMPDKADAKKTEAEIALMQKDMAELQAYTQQFQESMKQIHQWMATVKPSNDKQAVRSARKAQKSLFAYINKELLRIEGHFKNLPTFNDINEVNQKLVTHKALLQDLQTLQNTHKGKVLVKAPRS